jgi:hypothetical protein
MEKRRTFKRSKSPATKTAVKGKNLPTGGVPVKKHVQKKESPVKQTKPVEPVKKPVPHVEPESHHKKAEPEVIKHVAEDPRNPAIGEQPIASEMPTETADESVSQSDDIVVVQETMVTEVISDTNDTSGRKLSFIWIFMGIFIIFLAGGMVFLFLFQQPQKPEHVYTAPTDTPAPSKIPVPAPAKWNVEILNGSGIPGAAAKMAQKLKALGYTVVKTGNADDTQANTTFYLSKDFSAYANDFSADLLKQQITAKNGGELAESSISARIIIGSE